ncbi:MAG: DNA methyltransferase, partial [Pseudomonadota bacterium]|nr:DNA methyltransferase [Pseudomonadota bacterium]
VPILVVLGNPPYNGFAGVAVAEERDLSNAYRTTKQVQAPQGQGLNDLYVRFFRMAERRIVEFTGRGVVCFISNYSWLDGLSFTGMRERYLEAFDAIWIDNLHGDRIISEYAPDGQTSETIFAMAGSSPGIKIGTAIALLARREDRQTGSCQIRYRDMEQAKAAARRAALLASLGDSNLNDAYSSLVPTLRLGLPFKPRTVGQSYLEWPRLPDLFPVSFPGVKTSRDDFLVDIDRDRLLARLEKYFDPSVSHEDMRRIAPSVMESTARFKAEAVRDALRRRGLLAENIVRYCYRPFDVRWLYWEPETKLLDEKRTDYFRQVFIENLWMSAGQRNRKEAFYQPQFTALLADHHIVESNVGMFPLYLRPLPAAGNPATVDMFAAPEPAEEKTSLNLSPAALEYLSTQKSSAEETDGQVAELLWMHALAVLHAPAYRTENAGALRQDWPRIPLPKSRALLDASADLGRRIAALLDAETPLPGVTTDDIRPELRIIGVLSLVQNRPLDPAGDLRLTAGWGHAGKGGVTMPGKGRSVTRDYAPAEQAVFDQSVGLELALACLGGTTRDVYLNDAACWRNVPERVWTYTIGGYQVIKKWLSYRERAVLGRSLTPQEAREVTNIARRVAAILLLEPALDASYGAVKADAGKAEAGGI